MRAVVCVAPGSADQLEIQRVDDPVPGPGEVLLRVGATALNRADIHQREGRYPPPPGASPILGLEAAGHVEAVGSQVTEWKPGDRAFALLSGGGYAEKVTVSAGHLLRIPPGMSIVEAAAIAEAFLTAWQALFVIGSPRPGDAILLHAGGSGVGTAGIQMARQMGLRVFVTCSDGKRSACEALGAERAIDYRSERFADIVLDATAGAGVRVIVDPVGAPYLADDLKCLAWDGVVVLLSTMGGSRVESLDLRDLFRRRGTITASTLRNRSDEYKADLVGGFVRRAMPWLEGGAMKPVVDTVMPWTDVAQAHRRLESGVTVGKIVLVVDPAIE